MPLPRVPLRRMPGGSRLRFRELVENLLQIQPLYGILNLISGCQKVHFWTACP